jgi:amino acid transporter
VLIVGELASMLPEEGGYYRWVDRAFGPLPGVSKWRSTAQNRALRGGFRIPLGRGGVATLAALPMIVLLGVIAISFHDGEYGLPAVIGATVAIAAGPVMYRLARRRTTR